MSAISGSRFDATSVLALQARAAGRHRGAPGPGGEKAFGKALEAAGVDPSKVADVQKQIRQAVEGVSKTGQRPDGDALKAAIDGVLKDNGVDVEKFKAALEAARPPGLHRAHVRRSDADEGGGAGPASAGRGSAPVGPGVDGVGGLVDVAA